MIYFSTETQPFSEQELEALLEQSIKSNTQAGITGFLLYKRGNFLQVIEGPDLAIHDLYAALRKDKRHKDLVPVEDKAVERREFEGWQMGFQNLDILSNNVIPGFTEYSNPFSYEEFQENPDRAHQLLMFFARHL